MRTSDMKRLGEAWASVTSKKQKGYTEEEIRELCHSKDHDCAITVNHPKWGLGKPVYESHAIPTDDGFVEWYDVQFKHGVEERVPVADMEVIEEAKHMKKNKAEGNAFTAALQAAKEKGDDTFVVAGKKYNVKTEEARLAKEDASNDKSDDGDGIDKVDPKAAKKKFKDRKDKDIDNDGDVDDSDKFLHKRRKAIGKAMAKDEENGEDENGEEKDGEEAPAKDDKKKKKIVGNDGEKKAEISKIGEATDELLNMIETAAKQQKSNATKPEGIMDKESPKSKEFADAHAKSDKKIEDNVDDAKDKTTKAGQATKAKSGKRPQDNQTGDKDVVKSTEAPAKNQMEVYVQKIRKDNKGI